ncbi:MAG: hypothetical protein Q4A33_01965 [Candidatus Saccharibacteria bacterium]|nr:hypothetical protein [Candidatus Saccharibacteria bacterium]
MMTGVLLVALTFYAITRNEARRTGKIKTRLGEMLIVGLILGGALAREFPAILKDNLVLDCALALACAFIGVLAYFRMEHLAEEYHVHDKKRVYVYDPTYFGRNLLVLSMTILLIIAVVCLGIALRGAFIITSLLDQMCGPAHIAVEMAGIIAMTIGGLALFLDLYQGFIAGK